MIYSRYIKRLFLLTLLLVTLFSCAQPPKAGHRIVVAASILPLMDFTRQVGGDWVDAFAIVPPGVNPHTFELTPEILRKTSQAKLLVLNGIGLEFWAKKLISNLKEGELMVVNTSEGVEVLQDDDHAEGNPHIWLDPLLAMHQVEQICAGLCRVDSAHAQHYRSRAEQYIAELENLHREIAAEVATWQYRSFICFHPSWNYFAERYGLVQAAVIEKRPGFEPNPREVAEIITIAKEIKAKAIFAEQQFPIKISEAIAHECGAIVIRLDPLGTDTATFDYIQLMRKNVQQMALALK